MRRAARMLVRVLFVLTCASRLFAQPPPRDGRLLVTVVDQTRAVIPGATVTISGLEEAARAVTVEPTRTCCSFSPNCAAVSAVIARASASPCSLVQALALPEFTTMA